MRSWVMAQVGHLPKRLREMKKEPLIPAGAPLNYVSGI